MQNENVCLFLTRRKLLKQSRVAKRKKDVADSFQIPSSLLSTILKQREAILSATDTEGSRKKSRISEFLSLKQPFYTWFDQVSKLSKYFRWRSF